MIDLSFDAGYLQRQFQRRHGPDLGEIALNNELSRRRDENAEVATLQIEHADCSARLDAITHAFASATMEQQRRADAAKAAWLVICEAMRDAEIENSQRRAPLELRCADINSRIGTIANKRLADRENVKFAEFIRASEVRQLTESRTQKVGPSVPPLRS